jgi:magnesium transporter
MPRNAGRRSRKAGLPPGSLVFVGPRRVEKTTITVIDYNETVVRETQVAGPEECRQYITGNTVTWINVTGLHDSQVFSRIGEVFGVHPLILEDIMSTGQRPRFEDHGSLLYCVLEMLYRPEGSTDVVAEQVSMLLGKGFLLTFQEVDGDVFDIIRNRIRTGKGRVRKMGCDYLAYSLIDAIVDNYFVVLEEVGDKIENLQDAVIESPQPKTMQSIHRLKREMIFMRKNLWPLREMVNALDKSESELLSETLTPYLRDVYEHTFQVIDTVETWREMISDATDMYMTGVSNRMNEVMKVLTVIATIFMPLTFIAGVYGMNFKHMPELEWHWGYLATWAVMISVAVGMGVFFKRKNWW